MNRTQTFIAALAGIAAMYAIHFGGSLYFVLDDAGKQRRDSNQLVMSLNADTDGAEISSILLDRHKWIRDRIPSGRAKAELIESRKSLDVAVDQTKSREERIAAVIEHRRRMNDCAGMLNKTGRQSISLAWYALLAQVIVLLVSAVWTKR